MSETIMEGVAEACSQLDVEGLRSDIAVLKAARALTAFEGRDEVEAADVIRVFDFAVTHRMKEKAVAHSRMKDILLQKLQAKIIKSKQVKKPELSNLPEISSSPLPPQRIKKKRRKITRPLGRVISFLLILGLLISLSFVTALANLLFKVMFFGMPVQNLFGSLNFKIVLINFGVISILFSILSFLSSKFRRPIRYLYMFLGEGVERRIVHQQRPPPDDDEDKKYEIKDTSGVINIPLFASLKRLYKILISKGVKLLEHRDREDGKRYKFVLGRRMDSRLRSLMGRQSKTKARSQRGRYVSYEFPKRKPWDLALGPTMRAAAPYQRARSGLRDRYGLALKVEVEDVRVKVREIRAPLTILLLLDMSESMISSLSNVRNAILSMRDIAFKRRDRIGVVIFKGGGASTLQSPTTNLNLVVRKLMDVGASDFTPLASGMYEAWRVLRNEKTRNRETNPVLVIISDGIANVPLDAPLTHYTRPRFLNSAQADVIDVSYLLNREGISTLVINPSHVPIGSETTPKYKESITLKTGKRWLEPTELLIEIPRISGGYYYGIGEGGSLEQVILTEALNILQIT
jgi:Mg-chelatase subunit ChlD